MRLIRSAWPSESADHYVLDPLFEWEQFRVVEVAGVLASAVKVYRRNLFWGGTTVTVGGLGDVVTAEAYRGLGYARLAIIDSLSYMKRTGCELSILFSGLSKLYERFGWRTVPLPILTGPIIPLQSDGQPSCVLRRFVAGRDLPAVAATYSECNRHYYGAVERSMAYWRGQLAWSAEDRSAFTVALHGDQIVGYMRASHLDERYIVDECLVREGHPNCRADLLRYAVRLAVEQGCTRIEYHDRAAKEHRELFGRMGLRVTQEARRNMMLRAIDFHTGYDADGVIDGRPIYLSRSDFF